MLVSNIYKSMNSQAFKITISEPTNACSECTTKQLMLEEKLLRISHKNLKKKVNQVNPNQVLSAKTTD